jgi:hypothetical protein
MWTIFKDSHIHHVNPLENRTKSFDNIPVHTVTCLLKAGIAEPEETAVVRKWLYKHLPVAINTRATMDAL